MSKEDKELTDEEIFVPDPDEDIWTAKPLTLRNTVVLIRILAGVLARAALSLEELFPDNQITEEGIIAMLDLLSDQLLYNLLCIITGASREEIDETYSAYRAVKVIIDFWEQEDMSKLLGEATRLARNQEFQERNTG